MRPRPTYQIEPIELRAQIWDRGHVEPWELLRICAWKSARGLAPLSLNDEQEIRDRTRDACQELRPLEDAGLPRVKGTSEMACFGGPGRMLRCPSPTPRSSVMMS